MGFLKLTAVASAALLLSGTAHGQTSKTSRPVPKQPQTPVESSAVTNPNGHPLLKPASAAPLTLRNGAKPTGLSGFYDYQSNGMSPGWVWVDRTNPQNIFTTYMLSLQAGDSVVISVNRRVGVARSTDGGNTWTATKDIIGRRLGFPYIGATQDFILVAAHGNAQNEGVQTEVLASDKAEISFTPVQTYPRASVSDRTGDDGAGVIWPAMVADPKNPGKIALIASLSPAQGETQAPLHYSSSAITEALPAWHAFSDSMATKTSGGNYVIASSASGNKMGIVYNNIDQDIDVRGLYYTESTDGGNSWATPTRIFANDPNVEEFDNRNGDPDTLQGGSNMDLIFAGETPHVVFSTTVNGLFVSEAIYHWDGANGMQRIAREDSVNGIGQITSPAISGLLTKTQPNMQGIDYPTLAASADGKNVLVVFQANAQFTSEDNATYVASEDGFSYYRLWAVGSADGGKKFTQPFMIQDFAGEGDSASIEYPSLDEMLRGSAETGYKYSLAFQARRHPGMYAFTVADVDPDPGVTQPADAGPTEEVFQYFQTGTLPSLTVGVDREQAEFASKAALSCFPNPASSNVTLRYTLPTSGKVDVKIFNTLGVEVAAPVVGANGYAGGYSISADVSTLPAGAYRVVLTQNGLSMSKTLNVIR